ncbi:MAG: hypothetical protein ACRD42_00940, partial [Nitrososphaeraceae archaeon]
MGAMLLAALCIMLVPIPIAIVANHMNTLRGIPSGTDLGETLTTFEHAAYFGVLAIIVGILLMPNISKFKVGAGIEFEAATQITDPVQHDDIQMKNPILSDDFSHIVTLNEHHEMPFKYTAQMSTMPLKYQKQRFEMPINSIKMPVARGLMSGKM